ncbi:MAG: preprotein translocase subunit YajC [Acetobacter sp.]|nr:preprotein translocase subunit YajC [Acetobacter sp.]
MFYSVISPVVSSIIPAAYAQSTRSGGGESAEIISLIPLLIIFAIFYFLLIRPQQLHHKQLRAELKALRRGDRIVTAGGIIGTVQRTQEDAPEIEVEIAPNVRVLVQRNTIAAVLTSTAKPVNNETAKKK